MHKEKKLAVGDLYEKYWKELYIVAFRRLQSEEDVEDILHDIFLSLLTDDIYLHNDASIRAFLHQRLKSRIINFYRKQVVQTTYAQEALYSGEATASDGSSYVMSRELESVVRGEIDRMPEKMKEIFLLSRNDMLSSEEIATQLNLSNQTVRNQISMAIKRIRLAVQAYRQDDMGTPKLDTVISIACLLLINY